LIQNPNFVSSDWFLISIFAIELLVLLVLLVPRLLAGITLVVWLIVLQKIATAVGGGVSVAKAQHPWMVVVGP
jgi:hypothetical protein